MKVGITGLGFIGSTLVNLLLNEGHSVVGMDNRYKENLDNVISFSLNPNFQFILGDVTETSHVKKFYDTGVDYVVHTSALVGFPRCDRFKDLAYSVNVDGTKNMICLKPPNVGLIFTSTGSVYKPGQLVCTELSEVDPPSWYGKTKKMAEDIVLSNKRSICHRYATACGVGFSTLRVNLLLNTLVFNAVNDKCISIFEGGFRRVFINVLDLVEAIKTTIEQFDTLIDDENRVYNVGNNDMSFTKLELANIIKEKTQCHIVEVSTFTDSDCRDYGYDSSKFMKKSNWKPKIDVNSTIDSLIKVMPLLTPHSRYD